MKISPNWLILPIIMGKQYPRGVRELAKQLKDEGVTEEDIAKKQGVEPTDQIHTMAFCREMVESIRLIEGKPELPDACIIYCDDGTYEDVAYPVEKMVKLHDRFMSMEPTAISSEPTVVHHVHHSNPLEDDEDDD